ncbi:hypothetical protein B0H10DRAFT_2281533 [Mycena sp. CBHHK59/15]|nr:hypothetical protein B0H10DRAFT_2244274 [Mycena sp. CBHHK59/15]KAJ6627642.1 hypothetical protein B0H10DRAFT_1941003 [Mycena sp. CBHHK59/15]KAJ6627875.1 hypothetical protein B0H10DRAFT_2281533 [Mycena sp. CBHHK59/15]
MSDDEAFMQKMQALVANRPTHSNPRKRPRNDSTPSHGGSDDENETIPSTLLQPLSISNALVSRNVAANVKNYAKKRKLRGDQLTEVDTFLVDTQTVRDAKLYIGILGIQNDLQKLIAAKPPYAVTPELKVNIQAYMAPILLSSKLGSYKGEEPSQLVFDLIKKHRFDMPAGFEHNPAICAKLLAAIQEALTQARSRYKKLLFASVKVMQNKLVIDLPVEKHQNLFGLAQSFVDGSKCRINGGLVGRIALMRAVFLEYPGTNFYDKLDTRLVLMRKTAGGDAEAIDLMFEGLIVEDKQNHGDVEIVYQGTDDIQEEVDATIAAAGVIDAAITVSADATGDDGMDPEDRTVPSGSGSD